MKHIIAALMAVMLSLTAYAGAMDSRNVGRAGFNDLSDEQQAQIIAQVAAMKGQQSSVVGAIAEVDPDVVDKWVGMGQAIAKTIGEVAKELGIAVNEFAKSPVGILVVALVIGSVAGGPIVHVMGGILVLIVGLGAVYFLNRKADNWEYVYSPDKTNIFGNARLVSKTRTGSDSDAIITSIIFTVITIIAALITAFSW